MGRTSTLSGTTMTTPSGTVDAARQAATGYALRAPPSAPCRALKDLHHFLGHEQHVCLSALHRCDTLDQISLGKALGMDRATVGQMLRRLESRGLVRRTISTEDSRCKLVTLTPAGKKLVAPADAAAEQVSERLLAALTPNERKKLVSLLAKAIGALNDESSTPVEPPPLQPRARADRVS